MHSFSLSFHRFYAFVLPLRLCFIIEPFHPNRSGPYSVHHLHACSPWWLPADVTLTTILAIDVLVSSNTAIKRNGVVTVNRSEIFKSRIPHIWIDIVGIIPWEYVLGQNRWEKISHFSQIFGWESPVFS